MLVVSGAKILTSSAAGEFKGDILLEAGKIKELGPEIDIPDEAEVIDASDKVVMPGLIDAHTHVGIWEEGIGKVGADANELSEPITPHLRAIDGINPFDRGFEDALTGGVTTVCTGPGSANVLSGESIALKTYGKTVDEMLIKDPIGAKAAFGENPKKVYGKKEKSPYTRMAIAALLREALEETKNYLKSDEAGYNIKYEALKKVLTKKIPLKAHAHRADDIMTAVRIAKEYDLDLTIEHGTEGHKIADYLAAEDIPVVFGPTMSGRSKVELRERSFSTAVKLREAGVEIALMTDHPVIPINYLLLVAELAYKAGLSREDALAAITINPAKILGIDEQVGSLEPGKDADLIILADDPFSFNNKIETVIIDGKIIKR